jgi:hypothetical protein
MNNAVLGEVGFRQILQGKWETWRGHRKYYPTAVMWWERYVKRMLRQTITWEGAPRRRDRRSLKNFYYEAIYNLLQTPGDHAITVITLKNLKAKITRLHSEEQKRLLLSNDDRDRLEGGEPSLYHLLKARKQKATTIRPLHDGNGVLQMTANILTTFKDYTLEKFSRIHTDSGSLRRLLDTGHNTLPPESVETIDKPITLEELKYAVQKGKPNKAPGSDGISLENDVGHN